MRCRVTRAEFERAQVRKHRLAYLRRLATRYRTEAAPAWSKRAELQIIEGKWSKAWLAGNRTEADRLARVANTLRGLWHMEA